MKFTTCGLTLGSMMLPFLVFAVVINVSADERDGTTCSATAQWTLQNGEYVYSLNATAVCRGTCVSPYTCQPTSPAPTSICLCKDPTGPQEGA